MDFRLSDYLEHIRNSAATAISYVEGMDQAAFSKDLRTQHAVIMNLIVIGEAVAKIASTYPDFLNAHPEIPWQSMRGMRNRMAHGYYDIDLTIVWNTVEIFLPELLKKLPAQD